MMKICRDCRETKPFEEFHVDRQREDGLLGYCKACANKRARGRYDPEEQRKRRMKSLYGLGWDEFILMYDLQDGKCWICGEFMPLEQSKKGGGRRVGPQIDHCHGTGRVRALLCVSCNVGLGNFGDSTETLLRAIKYIEVFK